jgi:hypothetical protein
MSTPVHILLVSIPIHKGHGNELQPGKDMFSTQRYRSRSRSCRLVPTLHPPLTCATPKSPRLSTVRLSEEPDANGAAKPSCMPCPLGNCILYCSSIRPPSTPNRAAWLSHAFVCKPLREVTGKASHDWKGGEHSSAFLTHEFIASGWKREDRESYFNLGQKKTRQEKRNTNEREPAIVRHPQPQGRHAPSPPALCARVP